MSFWTEVTVYGHFCASMGQLCQSVGSRMVVGVIPVSRVCPRLHTAHPREFHVFPAGSNAVIAGCILLLSQQGRTSEMSIEGRGKTWHSSSEGDEWEKCPWDKQPLRHWGETRVKRCSRYWSREFSAAWGESSWKSARRKEQRGAAERNHSGLSTDPHSLSQLCYLRGGSKGVGMKEFEPGKTGREEGVLNSFGSHYPNLFYLAIN